MNELNLDLLWKTLKKAWIIILTITIGIMIVVGLVTHFVIPKKYSSSIKCYVVNINTDYAYTTTNLLDASKYLINDYISIIKSDRVLIPICEELVKQGYDGITPAYIRSSRMITGGVDSADTNVFTLNISHSDKKLAHNLAMIISEKAPELVTKISRPELNKQNESETDTLNCFEVLTYPVEAESHDSPSLTSNVLLAGIAAAAITYIVFVIYALINSRITTEEDIKKILDRPLIGSIPSWENTATK